mmetsp:Transcript_2526/g.4376  ORF Transcript_2526/g.4376 Transcript_2526/m.4376 type:complete len:344 (-) Transcript_2526:25-1056(-)
MGAWSRLCALVCCTLLRTASSTLRNFLQKQNHAVRNCPVCTDAKAVGTLPAELVEASGMCASQKHAGIYYAINDSSLPLTLVAMRETGEVVQRLELKGFDLQTNLAWMAEGSHNDMESLTIAPCQVPAAGGSVASESCIYLGNTGQNCARTGCDFLRKDGLISIVRFVEPEQLPSGRLGSTVDLTGEVSWSRFPAGDGPYDVETLLSGAQGELLVVTKHEHQKAGVYALPDFSSERGMQNPGILERVADVDPKGGMFTGGSVLVAGGVAKSVALLTYGKVLYFNIAPGQSIGDALRGQPCELSHPVRNSTLPFTEALEWVPGTRDYILVSEGKGTRIARVSCS